MRRIYERQRRRQGRKWPKPNPWKRFLLRDLPAPGTIVGYNICGGKPMTHRQLLMSLPPKATWNFGRYRYRAAGESMKDWIVREDARALKQAMKKPPRLIPYSDGLLMALLTAKMRAGKKKGKWFDLNSLSNEQLERIAAGEDSLAVLKEKR